MSDITGTSSCPCGSGDTLDACCGPYVRGTASPPTAESTMRSRYAAFALGEVDYIMDTHHPETVGEIDRGEVSRWSHNSTWLGLTIDETTDGGHDDDDGTVTFTARYRLDGNTINHREVAHFVRLDGLWRFHNAHSPDADDEEVEEVELVPVGPASTVGRNDPCPCGSGKKYKKCHGAAA